MFWNVLKAIFAFAFASTSHVSAHRVSLMTGDGGFTAEDAHFNRK